MDDGNRFSESRAMSEKGTDWAIGVARELFEKANPKRWGHVEGAVAKARSFAAAVPGDEERLVTIVALHDCGFAAEAHDTGFSTIDGARYLRGLGVEKRLVDLMANLCVGEIEAELRGMADHHRDFGPDERTALRDAFWTCCLTTGPDGRSLTVAERCDEWLVRYADLGYLPEYLRRCRGELEAAERRTLARLAVAIG